MKKLILEGMAASIGTGTGRVRLVYGSVDNAKFQQDEVLVTKLTNPTMLPMMIKAAAIVTDIGGLTSHPAIVSREMGTPCVVNTKIATSTLKDGDLVEVDGTEGKVYLIS